MKEQVEDAWMSVISRYNHPDQRKSWFQFISAVIFYLLGVTLMILSLNWGYWISLLIAVPVAGLLIRIFIIFHDCGHGSYFKSPLLRKIAGFITGILTFTPYMTWSVNHQIHHKTAGNLDKRGVGDVWTMTVKEYLGSSAWNKLKYRVYRHPFAMFGVGALLGFVILSRFTHKDMVPSQRMGVYITNAGLLAIATGMSLLIGFKSFLMIQLPVIYLAGIMGIWLFYVQHQFDPSYWAHSDSWDYKKVALEGSSFYRLPGFFRWLTGNIGYHHVHHLSPLIPNYNLKRCHDENKNKIFSDIHPLTFRHSLHSLGFRLWDEDRGRMVSFRECR